MSCFLLIFFFCFGKIRAPEISEDFLFTAEGLLSNQNILYRVFPCFFPNGLHRELPN